MPIERSSISLIESVNLHLLTNLSPPLQPLPSSMTLTAMESVTRAGESRTVELFHSTSTLWELPSTSSPSTSTSISTSSSLPSTMPFSFQLTADLPHCIHLPYSGLEYKLEAKLHSTAGSKEEDRTTSTVCHLTRYSRPGDLSSLIGNSSSNNPFSSPNSSSSALQESTSNTISPDIDSIPKGQFSLSPHSWSISSPTSIQLQLGKTIYRRAEPMDLVVRIPPPESRALEEKGLRLRCVEAELVRVIEVRDGVGSSTSSTRENGETIAGDGAGWLNEKLNKGKEILPSGGEEADMEEIRQAIEKADWHAGNSRPISTHSFSYNSDVPDYEHGEGPSQGGTYSQDENPPLVGSSSSSSGLQTPSADHSSTSRTPNHFLAHEALLSHSGKLCRFNSQRAVLLRLTLHPPFAKANMPHPHPDHDTSSAAGPVYARAGGGGCESVSQETLLHKVSFKVKVRIGMTGEMGETRDVRLEREVWILPGAAGALEDQQLQPQPHPDLAGEGAETLGTTTEEAGASGSNTEGTIESTPSSPPPESSSRRDEKRQAAPLDFDASSTGPFASTSNQSAIEAPAGWQNQEEYDGFIDVGRTLEAGDEEDSASGSDEWDGAYTYEDAQRDQARELSALFSGSESGSTGRSGQASRTLSSTDPSSLCPPFPSTGILDLNSPLNQAQLRSHDSRGPPPSMSESAHDWHVDVDLEVEVEGVGSAMPRRGGRLSGLEASSMMASTIRSRDAPNDLPLSLWNAEDEAAAREIIRNHEDDHLDPPPPISPSEFHFEDPQPPTSSSQELDDSHDLPPPHSPPRPAYSLGASPETNAVSVFRQVENENSPLSSLSDSLPRRAGGIEPPPYVIPESLQNMGVETSSPSLSPQTGPSRDDEAHPPAYGHPSEQLSRRGVERSGISVSGPPGYEA